MKFLPRFKSSKSSVDTIDISCIFKWMSVFLLECSDFWVAKFRKIVFVSWENNRDCHITTSLSLKTMEVQIKGDQ